MKKPIFIVIILLTAVSFGCNSTRSIKKGKTSISVSRIGSTVEHLINTTDPNVNIGIKISAIKSNKTIYEKNAGRHFMPGSTIKLATLAAALHYLGPSYRFNTSLLTDGFAKPGVIKNLYLEGSGDPSLMDYDLRALALELKQMGIYKVTGDILINDQIFDDVLWGRGIMWDDRKNGYSAPISGININYNRLLIKTVPDLNNGSNAHTIVTPNTSFVEIISRARTTKNGGGRNINLTVERGKHREQAWPTTANDGLHRGDKIFVNGQISRNSDANYSMLAVNDPAMLAAIYLKEELNRVGIKTKGKVARAIAKKNLTRLATHQSRSLAEALIDFTKISNNIANDALIKTIAAQYGEKPATFTAGLKLVNDFLVNEVGIEANSVVTADGAGTSRYNLITPEQMVKLLNYAANHFHMAPEFMAALPIAGEDGTMGSRLTLEDVRGHVRAKTGSMTGVSSLAGYLTSPDNEKYAFAIMINGFIGSGAKYSRLQDQIVATMLGVDQEQLANIK